MLTSLRHGFEFLSLLNWITPTAATLDGLGRSGNILNRWTFFVDLDKSITRGYSQKHIQELLKKHGYDGWSRITMPFGNYSFVTSLDDAADIEVLLDKYKIPIKPISKRAPRRKQHNVITIPLGEFFRW